MSTCQQHHTDDNERSLTSRVCYFCNVTHPSVKKCIVCHLLMCANCKYQQPTTIDNNDPHRMFQIDQLHHQMQQSTTTTMMYSPSSRHLLPTPPIRSNNRHVPLVYNNIHNTAFQPDMNTARSFVSPGVPINSNIVTLKSVVDDVQQQPQEDYMTWSKADQQSMAESIIEEQKQFEDRFAHNEEMKNCIYWHNISVRPNIKELRKQFESSGGSEENSLSFVEWVFQQWQSTQSELQENTLRLKDSAFSAQYRCLEKVYKYYKLFQDHDVDTFTFQQLQDRISKVSETASMDAQKFSRTTKARPLSTTYIQSRYTHLSNEIKVAVASPARTLVKRKSPDEDNKNDNTNNIPRYTRPVVKSTRKNNNSNNNNNNNNNNIVIPHLQYQRLPQQYQEQQDSSPLMSSPYSPIMMMSMNNLTSSAIKSNTSPLAMLSPHSPLLHLTTNSNGNSMLTTLSQTPPRTPLSNEKPIIPAVPVTLGDLDRIPVVNNHSLRNERFQAYFEEVEEEEKKSAYYQNEQVVEMGTVMSIGVPTNHSVKLLCQRYACRFLSNNNHQMLIVLDCLRLEGDVTRAATIIQINEYLAQYHIPAYTSQKVKEKVLHTLQNLYMVLETPPFHSLSKVETTHEHVLQPYEKTSHTTNSQLSVDGVDHLHLYYRDNDPTVRRVLNDELVLDKVDIPYVVIPVCYSVDNHNTHFVSILIQYEHDNVFVVDPMSRVNSLAKTKRSLNSQLMGHLGELLNRTSPQLELNSDAVYLGIQDIEDYRNSGIYQVWFTNLLNEIINIPESLIDDNTNTSATTTRSKHIRALKREKEELVVRQIRTKFNQLIADRQQRFQDEKIKEEAMKVSKYEFYDKTPVIFRLNLDKLKSFCPIKDTARMKDEVDNKYSEFVEKEMYNELVSYLDEFRTMSLSDWQRFKDDFWMTETFCPELRESLKRHSIFITTETQQNKLINNVHRQLYRLIIEKQECNLLPSNQDLPTVPAAAATTVPRNLFGVDAEREEYIRILATSSPFHRF